MFITKDDLYRAIRQEELEQITRGDDTMIQYAIDVAQKEIRSYLADRYDVDTIFAQTGQLRHTLLLNFAVDIAIYILVAVALPGQSLEDRRARYKRAIDWLKQVRIGSIPTDLPVLPINEQNKTPVGKLHANPKRNNYY